MSNWYYTQAYTDPNPAHACRFGIETHPNYHCCCKCSDVAFCEKLIERMNLLAAREGIVGNVEVDENFWSVKLCNRDERCLDCNDAVHCLQLWTAQQIIF